NKPLIQQIVTGTGAIRAVCRSPARRARRSSPTAPRPRRSRAAASPGGDRAAWRAPAAPAPRRGVGIGQAPGIRAAIAAKEREVVLHHGWGIDGRKAAVE